MTNKSNVILDPRHRNVIYNNCDIFVLVVYAFIFILITYFHEPWFDEAQAWEIGKTATYREMLTVLTHTEGHPPLWSLILSLPAKLGIPYLIGLKGVSFVFSLLTIALIVFKSPFPSKIRYMLPFTYYFFYQYGVISRTYCVLDLACVLIAISFKKRNSKPWFFVGSMYLLCLTSAYGIMIAGGICFCWVWDIIMEAYNKRELQSHYKAPRILPLLALLIAVIPLIYLIMPTANTYAINDIRRYGLVRNTLILFFASPGSSFVSSSGLPIYELYDIIAGVVSTVIFFGFIFLISEKKQLKYYFIPLLLYCILMARYSNSHHIGICMMWTIAYIWAVYDEEYINSQFEKTCGSIAKINGLDVRKVRKLLPIVPCFLLGLSCFYSIETSIEDVILPYSESAAIANFIKEHGMEGADIMIQWNMDTRGMREEEIESAEDIDKYCSDNTFDAVAILPYFDKNIFFNHNIMNHVKGYATHMKRTSEEDAKIYELWRRTAIPEIIVGNAALDLVYDGEISIGDYVSVASMTGYYVSIVGANEVTRHIYVRKDCLEKYEFNKE